MSQRQSNLQVQLTAWLMRRTAVSGIRRVAPVSAALATEVGEVRRENQDRIAIARGRDRLGQPFTIAALADGIGGMREGTECAALTLGCLLSVVAVEAHTSSDPRQWLLHGIHTANDEVHTKQYGEGGSTLAAVLITANESMHWASVGDSRVYHANGVNLTQLSTDDTIAGQLGRGAEGGVEQSKLIQFIGIGNPLEASVSETHKSLGGTVFITTDGVHFLDSTPWFGQLVKHASDPGLCVRRLVELSKWCGGPDNASVAMISLGGALDEAMPLVPGCLEVWDPFGELQIIGEVPHPMTVQVITPAASLPLTEETRLAQSLARPESDAHPPTKKRNRSSKKSKPVTLKSALVEKSRVKTDVPQLLIEFPNKNS